MPNWAETDLSVTLPTRKAGEFKSYFLSHNPDENKDRKKYFGRTFLNDVDEEKNRNGMSLLRISCDCAWSADSCMSCLNEIIEPDPSKPHTFDDRQPNVTVFYGRDRGEKGQEAQKVKLEDIESDGSWIEWCYVFGKDGKWRYFECGHLKEGLKDLKEGLDEEYKRLGFPRPEGYYGFFTQGDIAKRRADWQKIKVVAMQ